jgi:cytochrome P450
MEMELNLLVSWFSIVLFILSAVYVVYSRTRRPSRRMPPSPPGWLPVIGHLHLLTDMPHHALAEMAKSMRAPLFHLQLGSITAVVISKPDLAKAACTTHGKALASRPHLLAGDILSFGRTDVTLAPAGPYHHMARGVVVSELLSSQRVATYGSIRLKEVGRLLALLGKSKNKETTVDLSRCLRIMASDVLCRVAFGRRFPQDKGDKLVAVFTEAQNLFSGFAVGDFFPELEPLASAVTGLRRRLRNCLVGLLEICNEFLDDHVTGKHQRIPGDRDEDFIDVLLRVQKSSGTDVLRLTDDNIMAIIIVRTTPLDR